MDYVSTDGHVFVRTMFGSSSAYKVFFLEGGGELWAEYIKMSVEGKGRLFLCHTDVRWPSLCQFYLG